MDRPLATWGATRAVRQMVRSLFGLPDHPDVWAPFAVRDDRSSDGITILKSQAGYLATMPSPDKRHEQRRLVVFDSRPEYLGYVVMAANNYTVPEHDHAEQVLDSLGATEAAKHELLFKRSANRATARTFSALATLLERISNPPNSPYLGSDIP
jgi:hypothetical protein